MHASYRDRRSLDLPVVWRPFLGRESPWLHRSITRIQHPAMMPSFLSTRPLTMTLDGWAGANFEDGFRAPKSITDGDADSEGALDNGERVRRRERPHVLRRYTWSYLRMRGIPIHPCNAHNLSRFRRILFSTDCSNRAICNRFWGYTQFRYSTDIYLFCRVPTNFQIR